MPIRRGVFSDPACKKNSVIIGMLVRSSPCRETKETQKKLWHRHLKRKKKKNTALLLVDQRGYLERDGKLLGQNFTHIKI